ncbi:MAG: MATE family efflux transporter [Lachnospiraceae bacterium]|nr:MATE family efflux transporter [Ruminococcus sp.]MCM1274830.1 MATE family efflux transporter [Lachnospiraceae bacterium]
MGTMPVQKLLITMSLPMVISMFVQAMYNLIDSIFVAQINQDALTAVNMAFPMQSLMIAFQTGLGVGMNAAVSRLLGEKKPREAGRAAVHGLLLTLVNYVVFLIVGLTLLPLFFNAQTNVEAVAGYGVEYLTVICCFSFGLFFQICFERFLQATGKTVYSMIMQGAGALVNIFLDPVFIFGVEFLGIPAMGVRGAAIATVAGQCISCAIGAALHFTKNRDLKLEFKGFKPDGATIKRIYAVGVPSIVMSALMSVMTYCMNMILKGYEEAAATAFGVYFKLQSFVIMPVFGMNNGIVPIIAYNYGARKGERIVKVIKLGIIYATCTMLVGLILFQLLPEFFLSFFNPNEELVRVGVPALRTLSFSFIFVGGSIVMTSAFQALGNGVWSLLVFVVRLLVPALPLAALLGMLGGTGAIWFALPISDLCGLALSVILMRKMYKNTVKPMITAAENTV